MHSHHLKIHPSVVNDPRVSQSKHIETIARAALKHVKGAQKILDAHFNPPKIKRNDLPIPPVYNQKVYSGW